jgi:lysozyme
VLCGPDVSNHQGTVDWGRVRVDGHKVAFGWAKATEGTTYNDPTFRHNWHGMHAAGLIRGAYHFARPHGTGAASIREHATAEAHHLLSALHAVGGVHDGDLPPALDLETSAGLSGAEIHAWVGTWVDVVTKAIGRKPVIYTGGFWKSYLAGYTESWGCPLWIAQYAPRPQLPRAWHAWTFWQYTDRARVPGIGTSDVSFFHGSQHELEHLARDPARPHPPPPHHDQPPPHHDPPPPHHDPTPTPGGPPQWRGRVLHQGVRGDDVKAWQKQLQRRGFIHIGADGVFGPHSATACQWLQMYLREHPNGQVDERLWRATWTAP